MRASRFAWCLGLLFVAITSFAQMYTVVDLGTLTGPSGFSYPRAGVNAFGQEAGYSNTRDCGANPPPGCNDVFFPFQAFRTPPHQPMDPTKDNLGTLGGIFSYAGGINDFGQVVGWATVTADLSSPSHGFRTAPGRAIDPKKDDLGTLGGSTSSALGINDFGQVVGEAALSGDTAAHAFRTRPNRRINPSTDDLGTLGGSKSSAWRIDLFGQVIGSSSTAGDAASHAFRTRPNRRINPATDDLGTLGGTVSTAFGINIFGQIAGSATTPGDAALHAFRTGPRRAINAATDDLGLLPNQTFSEALGLDDFGQVVGWPAFVYSSGVMYDLNELIDATSGWKISIATGINDVGEIAAQGAQPYAEGHALLLRPIYRAIVKSPISGDGTSIFSATRAVLPVKFQLRQHDEATCTLPPATIAVAKAGDSELAALDESVYSTPSANGVEFLIDPTGCQYVYHLNAARLGKGAYRVDISIHGIMVGHAVFALR